MQNMSDEEKELLVKKKRIDKNAEGSKDSFCFCMCIIFTLFFLLSIIGYLEISEDKYGTHILFSMVGFLVTVKGALSHYKRQVRIGNILKELSLVRGTTYEEERFIWENSKVRDVDLIKAKIDKLKKEKQI